MNTKITSFLNKHRTILSIFVFFICTTFMQAVPAFVNLTHYTKTLVFFITLILYFVLCCYMHHSKKLSTDDKVFLIILGGIIIRSFYVIFTGVSDRQHDEGYFSGLSDDLINPGHLGYIEYLCKFGHLPDFSPYQLFSYYHPPVHHIISCLFILGIEAFIKSPQKYYDVYVEELSEDYDIVLCEYLHLKSLEGMLCVKINDIVYLKLKDTSYCVEPNHSLSDPKNMSLTYDKETGVLTMRYTWTEGSEYYENKTTYFVD